MTLSERILLSRRHAGFSQAQLSAAVGVRRSAVSHWENGQPPSTGHLQAIALVAHVRFEWLATGRGAMALSEQSRLDAIPAVVDALLVEDPLELRLLAAFRNIASSAQVTLVELAQHLANRARRGGGRP